MILIEPDWPAPAAVFARTTTRLGGQSGGIYRGLNLGYHVGDDPAAVAANRVSLQRELPIGTKVQWLSQVHGSSAIQAGTGPDYPEGDASWTRESGWACALLTADCLPVLFCDRAGTVVAAAHAGWRGLAAGVLESTIASMSAEPGEILAWLGPAIGPTAFEVGPEVKSAFLAAAGAGSCDTVADCFTPRPLESARYFADLYGLARRRLADAGVVSVYGGNYCTFSEPGRFYSFRRDGQTGRMASLICLRPS
jgi:YfiH family protein